MKYKTKEQVRNEFINEIELLIAQHSHSSKSLINVLTDLTNDILLLIQNGSQVLPAFILAPNDTKENKVNRMNDGSELYPINQDKHVKCNISDILIW